MKRDAGTIDNAENWLNLCIYLPQISWVYDGYS